MTPEAQATLALFVGFLWGGIAACGVALWLLHERVSRLERFQRRLLADIMAPAGAQAPHRPAPEPTDALRNLMAGK